MLQRAAFPFEPRGVSATDRGVGGTVRWQVRIGSDLAGGLDAALVLDRHMPVRGGADPGVSMPLGA
jgi:hypothetical protein